MIQVVLIKNTSFFDEGIINPENLEIEKMKFAFNHDLYMHVRDQTVCLQGELLVNRIQEIPSIFFFVDFLRHHCPAF